MHAQLGGFQEPLRSEFRNAARSWLLRAQGQLQEIETTATKESATQLFRAGDPVNRKPGGVHTTQTGNQ